MSIDEVIETVRERIKLLTKGFPYNQEQINLFVLSYMAIAYIDNDITDLLDDVFSKVVILFNNGEFDEMLKKYYPMIDLSVDDYSPSGFDENEVYDDSFVVINSPHYDLVSLLDAIIHELKHALNSVVKNFQNDGKNPRYYSGLAYLELSNDAQWKFNFWDEVFNCFIVKIYLEQIAKFKTMEINDIGIKTLLEQFRMPKKYRYAYPETEMFLPLFNSQEVFKLYYNAVLYRDFEPLFKCMEDIYGDDPYYLFGSVLESNNDMPDPSYLPEEDLEIKGYFSESMKK